MLLEYVEDILKLMLDAKSVINKKEMERRLHQDVKLVEDRCPIFIVDSDTVCTYRTQTIEIAKEMGYSDTRIMKFDTLESIFNAIESVMRMSVVPKWILCNREGVLGINRTDLLSPVRIEFIVRLEKTYQVSF